ncbi:unnamed protein product [Brassicogethes aeneus]|uniref:Uncharacterized protein n=1 Tax=Brassicogethes aeneus TaxID=1431903 RepID=A0A9P0BAG2_BRAAE|nr:unnamed protein product [Brassicogethes aeneus]
MSSLTARILALAASTSSKNDRKVNNILNSCDVEVSQNLNGKTNPVSVYLILCFNEPVDSHIFYDIPVVFENINITDNTIEYMIINDPNIRSSDSERDKIEQLEELFPLQRKNKTEVYNLYKEHCELQQSQPLSICSFMDALSEMNISIHQPKKDQCDLCCAYKVGNVTEEQYKNHIEKKEQARKEKSKDKEAAKRKECYVFTTDVQAVKLCPMLYASKLYVRSKLQIHNFSIYNLTTHHCANYCWNKTECELVSSIFTTCIIKHLEKFCTDKIKTIILYSDGCGYQNMNAVLANALLNLAMEQGVTIFQVSGKGTHPGGGGPRARID